MVSLRVAVTARRLADAPRSNDPGPSRKTSQRQPVIALAVGSFPRRQGYCLRGGGLFVTHMKKKNKTGMTMVRLEPIAVQMIDHVCKVEGLTCEEVLKTLMHCRLTEKEGN